MDAFGSGWTDTSNAPERACGPGMDAAFGTERGKLINCFYFIIESNS